MGKLKICGLNECDGVLSITYLRTRDNGDKVRTRKCSRCKRLSHTIEIDVSKYDGMRELVKDLQIAMRKFKESL